MGNMLALLKTFENVDKTAVTTNSSEKVTLNIK